MLVPDLKPDPASGVFYLHWTEPGPHGQRGRSKRVSTRTRDLAAAKAFLGQWLLMEREAPAAPGQVFTVAELWTLYREKHVEKHVEAVDTADYAWANLEPHFGALTLAEVAGAVEGYERKRTSGEIGRKSSKPSTVRRELVTLRAAINWCADPKRQVIAAADVPAFDLPSEGAPRDRWLRVPEVQKLLDAAVALRRGGRMSKGERFLWLALETAGRKEALLELTWDRVDFDIGIIDLNRPGRRVTKKRRAIVAISDALRPVLERMKREAVNDHVLDNEADVWRTVAGIAERAGIPDVSPHVLRHTAATHMARRGVPLWTIAKVLGNSLAMVEKVYAKWQPDAGRSAVNAISGGALAAAE